MLKKLLTLEVYVEVKVKKDDDTKEEVFIIQKGKPIDFFMLIIEGRIEANVGKEELIFESGPFTYFGLQVLTQLVEDTKSPMLGQIIKILHSCKLWASSIWKPFIFNSKIMFLACFQGGKAQEGDLYL